MYGINETIKKLGLTENEKTLIQRQAQMLHLKRIGKYFTNKEIQYLKDNYASKTVNEITSILHKNKSAVLHMACKLGLSNDIYYYSDEDVQFLKDNYNKLSNQQLADKLGKTSSAIETKISKLGLTKDVIWTVEEIKILKNVYPNYTNQKIVKEFLINRNATSIATMAHKFDLVKTKEKSVKWYDMEDMIKDLYDVAIKIGRTPYYNELNNFNLPSETTYRRYFGTYRKACAEAGLLPNSTKIGNQNVTCSISKNGSICLSVSESIICDIWIKII
jgi:transcriptional regulator with PAS, ATPase and Fis domain